jgi:heme exporter protein D
MWNSPSEFFAMGGYAFYVWSSFGMCALVLVWEPLVIRARNKAVRLRLQQQSLADQFDKESSQ